MDDFSGFFNRIRYICTVWALDGLSVARERLKVFLVYPAGIIPFLNFIPFTVLADHVDRSAFIKICVPHLLEGRLDKAVSILL